MLPFPSYTLRDAPFFPYSSRDLLLPQTTSKAASLFPYIAKNDNFLL
jgi:hypothetical protein